MTERRSSRHLRTEKFSTFDYAKEGFQVTTEIYGDGKVRIDRVHKPGTYYMAVTFINTKGVMAVTGDLGNYIFEREFHPAASNWVSCGYWLEKLSDYYSGQKGVEYDPEATRLLIKSMLDGTDDGVREQPLTEEEREYLEERLNDASGDDWAYEVEAHLNTVGRFNEDAELVPLCRKLKYRLGCIFDAFNFACDFIEDLGNKEQEK